MQRGMAFIAVGVLLFLGSMVSAQTIVRDSRNSDTCWATGDVNGNGVSLTMGDLSALINFVYNGVLPAGPLWQCDLNGDDHVDQADIDIYQCYFAHGLSCFPTYPVPTDCDPDTVRGACCQIDSCRVRSSENCLLVGGNYQGDGTDCNPNPCLAPWGACCWPDGSCTQVQDPTNGCIALGGKYMGVNVPCSPNPCGGCVKPPDGLLAWWPLDETAPPTAHDLAGGDNNGLQMGSFSFVPGKVNGGYQFGPDGPYADDIVRASSDPFVTIGTGDFSADAWIYPVSFGAHCDIFAQQYPLCTDPIFDNRQTYFGGQDLDGVCFFVRDDGLGAGTAQLGLAMSSFPTPQTAFFGPVGAIGLNQWQHVAVTVSRTAGVGRFYINGSQVGTFVPISGPLFSTADGPILDIGHSTFLNNGGCQWTDRNFDGNIDEVQIFGRALTPAEILDIYNAGEHGKCRSRCFVPRRLLMRPAITSRMFALTIFDESAGPGPITYNWGIASSPNPLCPSGIVSNYATHFLFQSSSQPQVQVYPNVPYPISITTTKPSNPPFAKGDISCYSVWIQEAAKPQNMFFCRGSIRGARKWFSAPPINAPLPLYADSITLLSFPVTNIGDPSGQFSYQIGVISSCSCDSPAEDSIISLNGLPPGTKVTGSINIPLGDSAEVLVTARLTQFESNSIQEVVLIADWDSTETMTEGPGIAIRPVAFADCNGNGLDDLHDIQVGTSADTNGNAMPDECEYYGNEPCGVPGDANHDRAVNIGDAVYIINYIFKGGPAPIIKTEGDANGDCALNIGDAVYVINFIFKGGPPPNINDDCIWP